MFHTWVCFLLACLKIVACASVPHFTGSIARTDKFPSSTHHNHKPKIQNDLLLYKFYRGPADSTEVKFYRGSTDSTEVKFYRGPASKQIHIRPDRSKRGIVLIDEDFDVPGWSDGDYNSNGITVEKNATRGFAEGSGSSESSIPDERTLTKFTRFATPENLQLTSVLDHKTTDFETMDASGDGESPMISNATETAKDEVTSSTHASVSTEVSSQDTTDSVSSTHIAATTEFPREITDDSYEHLCMNFTCDFKDLIIFPRLSETVPEGINLTLTCSLANATEQGSLKWYKYNESDHFLLKEHSDGHEINFAIPKTILTHSGTYMCFKSTEHSCCHRKLEITVYEVPSYKQHFIIIGSVVAASLLVCIVIAICKSVNGKKYEDTTELQNAEKPFLL